MAYRNQKILFFIVGNIPTGTEQALIDRLADQAATVGVRTLLQDTTYDGKPEACNGIAIVDNANIPAAYSDTGPFPIVTPALGGEATIVNGQTGIHVQTAQGTAQVETATVAGTITKAGTIKATVTSAALTGSPLVVTAVVANGATAAQCAAALRLALAQNAAILKAFAVTGATTAIILTAKNRLANDGTLNIATDNDTTTGLTPAASSANTTAGVAPTDGKTNGVAIVVNDTLAGVYTA